MRARHVPGLSVDWTISAVIINIFMPRGKVGIRTIRFPIQAAVMDWFNFA